VLGGGNNAVNLCTGVLDGTGATYNGAVTSNTGNATRGVINKVAGSVHGGRSAICLNGGPVATSSTGPNWTFSTDTHWALGNRGAGDVPINGYSRRIAMAKQQWDDGTLQRITT
jgi:hypothetical protein